MMLALAACGDTPAAESAVEVPAVESPNAAETPEVPETPPVPELPVMSYAEFAAAEEGSEVAVETCVQAAQTWWDDKITVYAEDPDGAYFIRDMACAEADAAGLVPGQRIRVTGCKTDNAGEIEITDARFTLLEGEPYIANPGDVTALLGSDALIERQNRVCAFNGMTVEPYDETGAAFAYKDEAAQSNDLYFKLSKDGAVYDFCVPFFLFNQDSALYQTVEALEVGDVLDLEGFLCWEGGAVRPHVTALAPANQKSEGVMSYAEYLAAKEPDVTVEAFVQGVQTWRDGKVTVYAADPDGAYYIPDMTCSEAEAAALVPGRKIRVTGQKTEVDGALEIADASLEVLRGSYLTQPVDVTDLLINGDLRKYQGRLVSFTKLVVRYYDGSAAVIVPLDADGESGDLAFRASFMQARCNFSVLSRLCGADSELFQTVQTLHEGSIIDVTGFICWDKTVGMHVTSLTVVK